MRRVLAAVLLTAAPLLLFAPPSASAQRLLWEQRINGGFAPGQARPGGTSNRWAPKTLAVDAAGFIYAVGDAAKSGEWDFVTAAYAPDGMLRWTRFEDGPSSRDDVARAVTVDALGRVYVAGTIATATGRDFLIVSYDREGNRRFRLQKALPDHGSHQALSLVLDSLGRPVVAGTALKASQEQTVLLALDSEGNERWTRTLSPLDPTDLEAGASGEVYLAGSFFPGSGTGEFLLIRIDSDGNERWRRTLPSGASFLLPRDAVISGGRVCVTGTSAAAAYAEDLLTACWDSAGTLLWSQKKDFGLSSRDFSSALAVDAEGRVFVAGSAQRSAVVIAYSSTGAELWTHVRTVSAGESSGATRILATGDGGATVGGAEGPLGAAGLWTMRLLAGSEVAWSTKIPALPGRTESLSALVQSAQGSLLLLGSTALNSARPMPFLRTAALDSSGNIKWQRELLDTLDHYDDPAGVAVDSAHRIHLGGASWGAAFHQNALLASFDSSGRQRWLTRGEIYPLAEHPVVFARSTTGDLLLVGDLYQEDSDLLTMAFDAGGSPRWRNFWTSPGQSFEFGDAVAADPQGNVHAAGRIGSPSTDYGSPVFAAYDAAGNQRWAVQPSSLAGSWRAVGLVADAESRLFALLARAHFESPREFLLLAFGSTGNELWRLSGSDAGSGSGVPTALALGPDGNLYAIGSGSGVEGSALAVACVDRSGARLWSALWRGAESGSPTARAIAFDRDGNLYLAGVLSTARGFDFLILSLAPGGAARWARVVDGPAGGLDSAGAIAVGDNDTVYVTGPSNYQERTDILTIAYDRDGNELWRHLYDRGGYDTPKAIAALGPTALVLGRTDFDASSNSDLVLLRLAGPEAVDVDEDGIADATEQDASSSGDGNGDGFADFLQPEVVALRALGSGEPMILEVDPDCPRVQSAVLEPEAALPPADPASEYPLGLLSFTLACPEAELTLILPERATLPAAFRYRGRGPTSPGDPASDAWYDLPGAVFGSRAIGETTAATVRFLLTDGLLGDATAVDGLIAHRGGPARPRLSGGRPRRR